MSIFSRSGQAAFKLYQKQIDARGLALFRIVYAIVSFFQVRQILFFQHLIFDGTPYIDMPANDPGVILIIWMVSTLGIMFGLFTRISAIINYLCTVFFTFIAFRSFYLNHILLSMLQVNFLLLFLPVSRQWSVDRFLSQWRQRRSGAPVNAADTVSAMAYILPVFFVIGLVYFESNFYKLTDPLWLQGLGMWGPSSLSITTISRPGWVVNSILFEKLFGYTALCFEALFVFLMWQKRLRWPLFIIGVGLHIGILIEFPIPFFAYVMMSVYILVLPVGVYRYLDKVLPRKRMNGPVPLQIDETRIPRLARIEKVKQRLVLFFIYGVIALQAIVSFNANLVVEARRSAKMVGTGIDHALSDLSDFVCGPSTLFIGLTRNDLFTSDYVRGYTHIMRVAYINAVGQETNLPLTDMQGIPGEYGSDINWGKWMFFACNQNNNIGMRNMCIRAYTAFWAHKNGVDLNNARFRIYSRALTLPTGWQRDFLARQLADNNWVEAGAIVWANKQCTITPVGSGY